MWNKLPYILINWFQIFLIIEKIFNLKPFGHLNWFIIFIPIIVKEIGEFLFNKRES